MLTRCINELESQRVSKSRPTRFDRAPKAQRDVANLPQQSALTSDALQGASDAT